MKKNLFAILILLLSLSITVEGQSPIMNIWRNGSIIWSSTVDAMDSISFVVPAPSPTPEPLTPDELYDGRHQNPDYLYDLDSVAEITLTFTEADWNQYLTNFDNNPNNSLYVPSAFSYKKGTRSYTRDSVGVRPRGNTSRVRPEGSNGQPHSASGDWHHAHFGVKFTEYATGERFFGSDRVILKWFKEDPTYVREVFCYDLMRRFGVWSAPRSCYCRFSIKVQGDPKPVYMGVYELIENPRKGWLKARKDKGFIPDNDGNLWKGQYADASLSSADQGKMGIDSDDGHTTFVYALKLKKDSLPQAKQELCNFINGLRNNTSGSETLKTWLLTHMDVDLFLRAMAVEAMVGHWDDYWTSANNFYCYFDRNHKFYYIPFDMDNTLGTGLENFGNPGTKDLLNWGPRDNNRLLIQRVLSVPEFEQTYRSYILQLAQSDTLMKPEAAMDRVTAMQALIRNYVSNDTGEDMTMYDAPASWGRYHNYRLLSGGVGTGESSETNFFLTKVHSISFSEPIDPSDLPPVQAVNGKVLVVIHFSQEPCHNVTLSGNYQWSSGNLTYSPYWGGNSNNNDNNYAMFTPLSGYSGWYITTINKPSANDTYTIKPVQLNNSGEFEWQYQWDGTITILQGEGVTVDTNSWGEPQLQITSSASVVYVDATEWQHNPCE